MTLDQRRRTVVVRCCLALTLIVVAISNTAFVNSATAGDVQLLSDIPYKADAPTEYERARCKLDLYLPAEDEPSATLIWFHGGGLQNGDKTDDIATTLARRFASEGIAVASVNYRLSPKATFPAYIDDAAASVAFVRERIEKHGGSSERVFVSGHSAGGYLTAMVGLDAKYLETYGLKPTDLAGYLPVAGQMITHSTVRGEQGIPRTRPLIDTAAPAYHVAKSASPFINFVGDSDLPARAEENRYFVAAMKAAGHVDVTYMEVENRNHGTIASKISEADDPVAEAMKRFMQSR